MAENENGNGHRTLRYRVLQADEWQRLEPEFQRRGWYLPYKELAECVIAETEDGQLAGGLVMQVVLHAEPGFVTEGFEAQVNFLRLHELLQALIEGRGIFPGYVTTVTDDRQRGLVKHAGFDHIEGEVWRKQLAPPNAKEVDHARIVRESSRPN